MSGQVVRVAPSVETLEEFMGRAMMVGTYCLDHGLDIRSQHLWNIMMLSRGTHEYVPWGAPDV